MAVESDNDRLDVLSDFGVDVTMLGKTVTAIFDDGFEDALGSWVTTPVLTVRDIDIVGAIKSTPVVIGGVSYTVAEKPRSDGQGMSLIMLTLS